MTDVVRWVFVEGLAHVLAEDTDAAVGWVTVCGSEVSVMVPVYGVAPSLDVCCGCERLAGWGVSAPHLPVVPTVF